MKCETCMCIKSRKWLVVETYYKHGEYDITVFNSEIELKKFIWMRLDEYSIDDEQDPDDELEYDEVNYITRKMVKCDMEESLESVVERVVRLGNERVECQKGYGVREIREL